MKLLHISGAALASIALFVSFVPAFASAQQYTGCGSNYNYPYNTSSCTPGRLLVYVQTLNTYSNNNPSPSNVTVTVSGQNASPSTFPGSLSGTQVSVAGSYSVTAAPLPGYTPTYSVGCNGTITNNEQASCIITESVTSQYYSYPQPYPYQTPYPAVLSCSPANQTVAFGQTVTFTAVGGSGPYTWTTPSQTYQSVGAVLNVVLPIAGTQAVTVSSGGQSASCTVTIVPGGVGAIAPFTPSSGSVSPNAYLTSTYTPSLPNTGFEPMSAAGMAFAAAALIALSLVSFTYVRKAFASILG